ncbi:MAG: extracellular solute-binding protein [Candidatus Sumerlaeota bacterium]|nr:extracellular solute-binding protein [Candidatus Sumerlaeota bacterium]
MPLLPRPIAFRPALCLASLWFAWNLCAAGSAAAARVVVYSPHGPEILAEMKARFEAAYPDTRVEVQYLSQTDILAKLRAERNNPYCDVWWGGTTQFFDQGAAEGLLQPYKPTWAAAVGPEFRHPNDYWYGQFIQVPCFLFNEKLMSAKDAPRDWDDLLDPKWKGRIVIREPLASGTMKTIFSAMILRQIQAGKTEADGFQWLKRLDEQTAAYVPSPEALFEKIGKSPAGYVSLWNVTDALFQKNRNHYPFGFVVPAGPAPVSVDALAIAAASANVEGARRFYEFCSNVENSKWLAEVHYRFNARADLPPDTIPEWRKGVSFTPMQVDWADFNAKVGPWMERWQKEIRDRTK